MQHVDSDVVQIDVAVNAPEAGTIKELLASEEDTVTVGQDILRLELGGTPSGGGKEKAKEEPKEAAPEQQPTSSEPEQARDKNDVEEKSQQPQVTSEPKPEKPEKPSVQQQGSGPKAGAPDGPLGNREERRVGILPIGLVQPMANLDAQVKMNRMRLRIAERLKQSQNTAASLTTFNEVDMSSLMEFRKLYKDEILKKTGVKLGFMSAFSKACILAMKDVPAVNASIEGSSGGDTIVYRDYVDISVAVATEKGLVTPVVRNSESLDMVGIEKAIADLGKKVRCPTSQITTVC